LRSPARAARLGRDELLGELETTLDAIRQRVMAERALPQPDEWREWLALRAAVERAQRLAGMELRRLLFPRLHSDCTKWSVWMWNMRRERAISDAMTRWLLAEAEAVGDTRAIELQTKNARCNPY
jgi:hypothetical protein